MGVWQYRKEITVDSTKVDANLTDFPVLIHLNSDSDLADHAQSSGDDIKFHDASDTQIAHEIESYDASTGTLWAHVKLPSLSSSTDTTLYVYYGNPDATNQESVADVWSNGYEAVYHLDEEPANTGTILDSTGTVDLSVDNTPTSATGQLNTGLNFDPGDNDRLSATGLSGIGLADGSTYVSVWKNGENEPRQSIAFRALNSSGTRTMSTHVPWSNGTIFWDVGSSSGNYGRVSGSLPSEYYDGWHYFGFWYDTTSDTARIYTDDVKQVEGSVSKEIDPIAKLFIGGGSDGKIVDGSLDEVRFASVPRSAGWISTAYTSQADPLSFYSVGPEENTVVSKSAVVTASSKATGSTSQAETRNSSGSAVGETTASSPARHPADASVDATAATALPVILPTPIIEALTPTALTTEVATTTTEQARASVTTAKSTAIETKSRVFKFAFIEASASVGATSSLAKSSAPTLTLVTASPRAVLSPVALTSNRRALGGASDTDAAYETDSDRVEYDEQTDEIEYDTR